MKGRLLLKTDKMNLLVLIVLLSRTFFAVAVQGAISLGNLSFLEAGKWWTVYGSVIDIGCLGLLYWAVHSEGRTVSGIIGFTGAKWKNDLKHAGLILIVLLPITIGWGALLGYVMYGSNPPAIIAGPLPFWGEWYSVLIWPIGWAITEQLVYMGYALPKLITILNRKWAAVAIVMVFWALQHTVLPVTEDSQYAIYRFLTVVPMVMIPIVYLRTRRLVPLIIVHAISDTLSALSFYFLR